jgi:hypothetical protein
LSDVPVVDERANVQVGILHSAKEGSMRATRRVVLLSLVVIIGGLIPTPAFADYWVFTWEGTMTGYGRLAPLVPPDTPFLFQMIFDVAAPNTCPPPSDQRAGNYQGVRAFLSILGWRYRGPAYAEVNSPNGSCSGSITNTLFRTWTFDWNPPEQLDPDAGPPIVWQDTHGWPIGWELHWPAMEGGTILTDLPPDTPGQPLWLFADKQGDGVRGGGNVYVWLWTPDSDVAHSEVVR